MNMPLNIQRLFAAAGLGLFSVALYLHGNEALWNDEIYTLREFVFKGLSAVLSDYHVPNNHILANVLHWAWLKVTGARELGVLLDAAWRIRLWPALLAGPTAWLVFRAGKQIGGMPAGWLAVFFLLTGVTFQQFAFQIRGYPLGMLAAGGFLMLTLQWTAEQQLGRWQYVGLAAAVAALLYAVPFNVYVVAAVCVAALPAMKAVLRARGKTPVLAWLGAVAGGGLLAAALYLPVWSQVTSNEYVATGKAFQKLHLDNALLVVRHFMSWRWLLAPVFLAGAWYAWKQHTSRQQLILLAGALVLPFFFSALRGDTPPERIYSVLLPVFALLLTAGIEPLLRRLPAKTAGPAYVGILLYGLLTYGLSIYFVRQQLRRGLEGTTRYQDLNYNYYQHFYDPNREFDLFRSQFGGGTVLILESTDEHDLPVYLAHKRQAFVPLDSIDAYLRRRQPMYVSSNFPKAFMREMSKMTPAWSCRYLQPQIRCPRIVVCEPRGE